MRVLVLNCGSSSVKFAVIDTKTQESIASGLVENIGVNGHTKAKGPEGKIDFNFDCPTHAEAVDQVKKFLDAQKLTDTIEAIGHRVVHGGKYIKSEKVSQSIRLSTKPCRRRLTSTVSRTSSMKTTASAVTVHTAQATAS